MRIRSDVGVRDARETEGTNSPSARRIAFSDALCACLPLHGNGPLSKARVPKHRITESLYIDLADEGGRVLARRLKDMPDESTPHPAKIASPPLLPGDVIVAVNGERYANFKDCVAKIRGASDTLTLTVERR